VWARVGQPDSPLGPGSADPAGQPDCGSGSRLGTHETREPEPPLGGVGSGPAPWADRGQGAGAEEEPWRPWQGGAGGSAGAAGAAHAPSADAGPQAYGGYYWA
jgi:hypothetical protein